MKKKDDSKKESNNKGVYRSTKRDQYTVVLEDIRSQFRVFGEGLSYVSDTLDEHTKQFKEIRSDITEIRGDISAIKDRLTAVEERLINVEMELEFVKEQLSIIRHNQVTRDEFQLLETRVARREHIKKQN